MRFGVLDFGNADKKGERGNKVLFFQHLHHGAGGTGRSYAQQVSFLFQVLQGFLHPRKQRYGGGVPVLVEDAAIGGHAKLRLGILYARIQLLEAAFQGQADGGGALLRRAKGKAQLAHGLVHGSYDIAARIGQRPVKIEDYQFHNTSFR